jgi:hypothetical protein
MFIAGIRTCSHEVQLHLLQEASSCPPLTVALTLRQLI